MTVPVIRREARAFPPASLSPHLCSPIGYEVLLISAMCHMGKKLALNLSFTNLTRLNRCPYLYYRILTPICYIQSGHKMCASSLFRENLKLVLEAVLVIF